MNASARPLLPSLEPPAGIATMVQLIWPRDPAARREVLELARHVQSFLVARRCGGWAELDVHAFVRAHAPRPRAAIQLCLHLCGMLPWLIRSGELSRRAATGLWLQLHDACPDDADARASIALTLEHLGEPQWAEPRR